jgi:membrane protease YdiL (CAAX protease family)
MWRAAVLSSVIFGAMHLLNLLFGADPTATLLQAVYATALGFGFAAVTLRTGILWPVIVTHALVDFTGFVSADETVVIAMTATDVVVYAVYTALFAVYGLFMMRSVIRRRKTPPKPDASVAPERPGPFTG